MPQVPIYLDQGAATQHVGAGGTISVEAGGQITVQAGATIDVSAGTLVPGTNAIANGAVTTAKLAAGNVTTATVAAGAVTGPKLAPTGVIGGSFTGHNNAGACTLTGATVGQRVLALFEIDAAAGSTAAAAGFEAAITVADQIQQTSVSDLSTKTYAVILLPVAS